MKITASILSLMAASAMSGCVANAPPAETCADANTNAPAPAEAGPSSGAEEESDEGYAEDEGATDYDFLVPPASDGWGGDPCPFCGMG